MLSPLAPRARLALGLCVAASLAFGAWARLQGLDRKVRWFDETATFLSIAGRTRPELRALQDGQPRSVAMFRAFQEPSRERGVLATLRAQLAEEPQTPPLYGVLAREAALGLGGIGPRLLSALANLLALAAVGLLARALFDDPLAGWIAAALAAVSPLHVRYAQEARPYALWSLAVAGASLLLLRASRSGQRRDFTLYALAMAAALYTHLFSLLVLAAHAVWAAGGSRQTRRAWAAPALSLLLFAPWVGLLAAREATARATTAWAQEPMSLPALGHRWIGIVTSVFLRSGAEGGLLGGAEDPGTMLARAGIALCLLALVAAAAVRLIRTGPARSALFLCLLAALPMLGLMLPDLFLGGRRSAIPRYWVPVWIALELAVAGFLARGLRTPRRPVPWASAALLGVLLGAGAASVLGSARLTTWWDTDPDGLRATLEATRILNAAQARVATAARPYELLVLVGALENGVTILSVPEGPLPLAWPAAIDGGEPLYLYNPSRPLLAAARSRLSLTRCVDAAEVQLWCPAARLSHASNRVATAAGS